jgi:hypothetical protein
MRMLLMVMIAAIGIAIVGTNDASAVPFNARVASAKANAPVAVPNRGYCWQDRYSVRHCARVYQGSLRASGA